MVAASPVDLIKSKTDLVQLISAYGIGLKKSGRNWWACCPFHSEKTPSFCIWPEDDRWKCFGCGLGGDAFAFVMRHENLDFPGALRLLAEKAGVELEDRPRRPEDQTRKRRLLELNAAASLWFHSRLLEHPSGAAARDFVERRNLTHQTVLDWQLGFAPDTWDALRSHLVERGYSIDEQLAAGVLHESERGQPYDRFRNRLIYPIRDAAGHIVAFGGRDLGEDKKSAKFINSPQTELFDKSAMLYGMDRAKSGIRSRDQVIIVEGYMDAIMAHQHGEDNAVCSMGTSLTEHQLEQIKRLTTNVILALDPDTAGDIAMARGVEVGEHVFDRELVPVLSVNGLVRMEARLKADIRVMSLPRGKDPDEVIHEDVELWRQLVRDALPLLEYKFQQILTRHDLSQAKEKSAAAAELAGELRMVPDPIVRAHYIQKLATALNVSESDLKLAINQAPAAKARARRTADETAPDQTGITPESSQNRAANRPQLAQSPRLDPEDFLVMRALRYLDDAHLWSQNLRTDEVVKSENREVLQFLLKGLDQQATSSELPEAVAGHVAYLREIAAREPEIPTDSLQAEFELLILNLRRHNALRKQAERATLLSQAPDGRSRDVESGALDDLAALHSHQSELNRRTLLTRQ